jgi:hypothetical protein
VWRASFLLAVVLAGCGGGKEAASQETVSAPRSSHVVGSPSGAERVYVNTVGEWVLACTGPLEEYAGKPPTPRMRGLARRAEAACAGTGKTDAVLTRIAGYELAWGDARALPVRGGRSRESRVEPRFGEAASGLAGEETEVRCWSEDDWRAVASAGSPYDEDDDGGDGASELAGFVGDDRRIHLAPDICADLVDLVYGGAKEADTDLAFAVGALAHEARHTMGELREDRTECWAVQRLERTARLLGADAELAAGLAERYWEDVYPQQEPPYSSEECRDGGAFDLDPEWDDWP